MKALQGKVALVTGGSSGIGQTLFIDGGLTLYPSFETTWSSSYRWRSQGSRLSWPAFARA